MASSIYEQRLDAAKSRIIAAQARTITSKDKTILGALVIGLIVGFSAGVLA